MKRKLFGIILALTLAFTCFAVAACGNDGGKETPPGDPVTVELGYAEDTGVLSWNAVEGATKYIVRISNINDTAKSAETAETTLQLYLREGTSRIALIAEDAQGRELGNGSKIVELATDFGAPEKVSGLAYDKEAGALGWTAAEGAVKYLVSINSINNEQFAAVTNAETTSASYTVALEKGIYDASVIAVNKHGAKSHASSYRYASYVDPAYGTEISEGVYKLFDFEDENVLDLARYKEILQGGWIKASKKPEWAVVNKHEKPEDRGEAATVDFTSKALKVRAPYKGENETDPYSSSVAFTLPEPLENWGRIYYDMFRTTNPPAGLVLTDVDGRRIIKNVEYNNADTFEKWGTISFTKSELLASNSEFGAIAEIAFAQINTGGGVAYFDNVRFDMIDLGYFGESLYRRSTDTFTFDAVVGAQKYDMFVDGAETPIELTEPEYRFETALTTGNHSIKVIAYNGDCSREHTYEFAVGDKIKFNVEKESTGEFVLADFDTVEYREYMSRDGAQANKGDPQSEYSISGGSIHVISRRNWGNSYIKYTLPAPISKADISGICVNYKSSNDLMVYLIDENGKGMYMYTAPDSAKDYTTITKMLSAFEGTLDGEQIVAIAFSSRLSATAPVTIDVNEISYLSADYVGTFDTTSSYKRSTDLFTFGGAANATSYDLYVDSATTPITVTENSYDFNESEPLEAGNHSIRVVARKGSKFREYTYNFAIGEKIKFNVETAIDSNEYILADFNTIEYREYIKTSARTDLGRYYNYTISDGKLNISHNEDWGNGNLVYTFPTEIQGAYIIKFNGVITSHPYFIGIIYKNSWTYTDDKGNEQSTNTESIYSSSALTATTDLTYSVPMDKRDNPIVGIKINACYANDADGVAKTITLDSITYEKYVAVTGFNTKVADTENDYLLADFTVNGYNDYITLENADYSISDNKLVVTSNKGWSGVSVKYTLPEAITGAGEIRIKVAASDQVRLFNVYFADGSKITSATPAKGAGTLVIPIPADKRSVAVTAVEVGAVNATDDKTRTVEVDEITYILYTAETEFNSSVADVENGKLLADFNANGYYDYLTIVGDQKHGNQPSKTIEGGALTMSLTATALKRYVRYTFASPINKDDILSLSFVAKSNTNYRVYVFDESGNSAYRDFVASENYATNANVLSGYKDYAKLTGKIVALGFASNYAECYVDGKATVLTVDRIAYEYCDKITGFNQLVSGSTTEYLLADFNVNGYKQNLKVDGEHYNWDGPQTTYAVKDGKLVIDKLVESGWNRVLKYTFPTAIKADDIAQITFKLTTTEAINIWLLDENGEKLVSDKLLTGACTELSSVPYVVSYELAGKNISAIALSLNNYQKQSVVSIDEITYEKNVAITNFNTLVEGTENEYLLADFSVSGYKKYLSSTGSPFSVSDGVLTYTTLDYAKDNYVKYTFPTPLTIAEVEEIKVTYNSTADTRILFFGETETEKTYGWFSQKTGDTTKSSTAYSTFESGKIYGIGFSSSVKDTVINIKKITYTKKTA